MIKKSRRRRRVHVPQRRGPVLHGRSEPTGSRASWLDRDEIAAALRTQIEGRTIGTALEDGRRTPILICGSEQTRQAPTLLANLPLTLALGRHVALSQVALIHRVDGPVKIIGRTAAAWRWCGRMSVAATGRLRQAARRNCGGPVASPRLPTDLGRTVREPATRRSTSIGGRAGRTRTYLRPLIYDIRLNPPGAAGLREHPIRAYRRRVCACLYGRIPLGAGIGRIYRAARNCRAQRGGARLAFQPAARRAAFPRIASSSRVRCAGYGPC